MTIETKTKRRIYIFLSIILGILLGVIAYALMEKARINSSLAQGLAIDNGNEESAMAIFILGGVIFGYILGVRWWQIVYVKKRHWRLRKK